MKVNDELITIYSEAIRLAMKNNQVTGENNDYFITIAQLENLMGLFGV